MLPAFFSLKEVTTGKRETIFFPHERTTSSSLQNYKKKLNPQK